MLEHASLTPLSYTQRRLWFLDQLQGPNPNYNVALAFHLRGELRVNALRAAIKDLLERHETLRTVCVEQDGVPYQCLLDLDAISIDSVLHESAELLSMKDVQARAHTLSAICFDLTHDIPIRFTLLATDGGEYVLVMVLHHIAADGASMRPLMRDLGIAYRARAQGVMPEFERLPLNFRDYTRWQFDTLGQHDVQDSEMTRLLRWWTDALSGIPSTHDLPLDHVRLLNSQNRGASYRFEFPNDQYRTWVQLARQHRVTLFMVLQAALAALFYRISGSDDLVFGTPVANRPDEQLHELVGYFANTLVVRSDLSGNPSFSALLERIRGFDLAAYRHQELPFDVLVEQLAPERAKGQHPVFQIMLALQNHEPAVLDLDDLAVEVLPISNSVSKFDLTFNFTESRQAGVAHEVPQLVLDVEYDSSLFSAQTITQWVARLQRILDSVSTEPAVHIDQIEILDADERHWLTRTLNDSYRRDYTYLGINAWFDEIAQSHAEHAAVVDDEVSMSYKEMAHAVLHVAQGLRELGIEQGNIVAVALNRSRYNLIAMLALARLGAIYLPIDPAYPRERIQFMLDDAKPAFMLSNEQCRNAMALDKNYIDIVRLYSAIDRHVDVPQMPDDSLLSGAAYIIYTSGSTGRPKGVVCHHLGLENLARAQIEVLGLGPGDRVLQYASCNFDASISECMMSVLSGATLIFASSDELVPGAGLEVLMRRHAINVVTLTPVVAARVNPEDVPDLRLLIVAGDVCSRSLLARWQSKVRLFNAYGPTEASVCATMHECRPSSTANAELAPPIGRPISNVRTYVLDHAGNPVPAGTWGELYIGGVGVAIGYWNRPELNAERFLQDPFIDASNARMYRTGDVVRRDADGLLHFRGRQDRQVKLRGYRIETEEVDAALRHIAGVTDAHSCIVQTQTGESSLVAFLLRSSSINPEESIQIRRHLSAWLPEHMLPSQLVAVEQFPLTPNGKLDTRALCRVLDLESSYASEKNKAAPTSNLETRLCEIWKEVLKRPRLGIHDNFFHLGGHSLLAGVVVARIRQSLSCNISIRTIFEAPTIASLAQHLSASMSQALSASYARSPHSPALTDNGCPLSLAQERLWFLDQFAPQSATYNIPSLVSLRGALDVDALELAFLDLIVRQPVLRTRFLSVEGKPTQSWTSDPSFSLQRVDFSSFDKEVARDQARTLARDAASRPFDLGAGLLIQAGIIRIEPEENWLWFNVHHIVSDGWSMGVICDELSTCYEARRRKTAHALPAINYHYVDYAAWQLDALRTQWFEQDLQYWQNQLADAPAMIQLPTDRPRPPVQTYRGAECRITLDAPIMTALNALAARNGASIFMVLLSAYNIVLSRHSAQQDICIGVPVANREHAEVENLIGFFVNTVVMRTIVDESESFETLLHRVRKTSLDAFAHQSAPFEKVVERINPPREMSHPPLFQVMLSMQNASLNSLRFDDLSLQAEVIGSQIAKFDISLLVAESATKTDLIFEYNTDLFQHERIERFARHLARMLTLISADSHVPIHTIDMMDRDERLAQLYTWNQTSRAWSTEVTLIERLSNYASHTPDKVALIFQEERVTYRGLLEAVMTIAQQFTLREIGPGLCVAVYLHRSPDMLYTLLAVLAAGAAYIPLDPAYPIDRLNLMLDDAQPTLIVVDHHSHPLSLPPHTDCLTVDDLRATAPLSDAINETVKVWRPAPCDVSQRAYVLYTSGSTGRPKGVQISHGALNNFLHAMQESPGIVAQDVVMALTSISFDIAALELFLPLFSGACVVLADRETAMDASLLSRTLVRHQVSMMQATPATWRMLLGSGWPLNNRSLKLLCGGEALQADLRDALLEHCDEIWNMYGPTETTIWSSLKRITRDDPEISIGLPIANTAIYVLDRHGNFVPPGTAGELYIAGHGVALGYLNRDELTSEKFVQDKYTQFCNRRDPRMYRTGDLVRRRTDGAIEYIGRMDGMIKLRGYRVELGEIEAVLGGQSGVGQCVVLLRQLSGAGMTLVAYVEVSDFKVSDVDGSSVPGNDLEQLWRRELSKLLPDYMLPSYYVVLEEFPLTPNGKIDRKSLPDPVARPVNGVVNAASTPLEHAVLNIWSETLQSGQLGIHDNFFQAGGHSLLAGLVVSRINRQFGSELGVRSLFEAPTVAQYAQLISEAIIPTPAVGTPPMQSPGWCAIDRNLSVLNSSRETRCSIVLLPGAGNGADIYRHIAPELNDKGFRVFLVHHDGVDNDDAPQDQIDNMVSQYGRQISSHCGTDLILAGYCIGGTLGYELIRHLAGVPIHGLFLLDATLATNFLRLRAAQETMSFDEHEHMRGFFRAICEIHAPPGHGITGDSFLDMSLDGCIELTVRAVSVGDPEHRQAWRDILLRRYRAEHAHTKAMHHYWRINAGGTQHKLVQQHCIVSAIQTEEMQALAPTKESDLLELGFSEAHITAVRGKHERVLIEHQATIVQQLADFAHRINETSKVVFETKEAVSSTTNAAAKSEAESICRDVREELEGCV